MTHLRKTLVVVGHGMVGHRFVQAAIERGLTETYDVVVVGEEPRPAYDRVALTSFFSAESADELSLLPEGRYDDPRVRLLLGTEVAGVDRDARTVALSTGEAIGYDALVLATGAAPFVPPVPGRDLAGLLRLPDHRGPRGDPRGVAGPATRRRRHRRRPARARGGERAGPARPGDPRRRDGAPADAGAARRRRRQPRWSGTSRSSASPCTPGAATGRASPATAGSSRWRSARSRSTPRSWCSPPASGPRDQLARDAGLDVGRARRRTRRRAVPHLRPARLRDRGVRGARRPDVRPGRAGLLDGRGRRDALLDGPGTFNGADMSTKLKLLGVDVASFGDAFATTDGALELVFADAVAGVYKKLVVDDDRDPPPRRDPGRRRVGVRRAAADGRLRHRAARRTPRS